MLLAEETDKGPDPQYRGGRIQVNKSQKELLVSDQTLMAHPTTAKLVNYNARYGSILARKFVAATVHMGNLDVLTGRNREIGRNYHFVN